MGETSKTKQDYEREGRFNKAMHIAKYCQRNGLGVEQFERWGDAQWLMVSAAAGQNSKKGPSDVTRAMVAGFLKDPVKLRTP